MFALLPSTCTATQTFSVWHTFVLKSDFAIGAQSSQIRKTVPSQSSSSFTMSNKFSGSSRLHKELQCLAAFAAYDATNKKKTMSSTAINKNVESLYVGDPADEESMGLAEQLVCGIWPVCRSLQH